MMGDYSNSCIIHLVIHNIQLPRGHTSVSDMKIYYENLVGLFSGRDARNLSLPSQALCMWPTWRRGVPTVKRICYYDVAREEQLHQHQMQVTSTLSSRLSWVKGTQPWGGGGDHHSLPSYGVYHSVVTSESLMEAFFSLASRRRKKPAVSISTRERNKNVRSNSDKYHIQMNITRKRNNLATRDSR